MMFSERVFDNKNKYFRYESSHWNNSNHVIGLYEHRQKPEVWHGLLNIFIF